MKTPDKLIRFEYGYDEDGICGLWPVERRAPEGAGVFFYGPLLSIPFWLVIAWAFGWL